MTTNLNHLNQANNANHVRITGAEADELFRALHDALARVQDSDVQRLRVLGRSNNGLPISFDGKWEPFLGHTIGYNNASKPPRIAIVAPSRVLGRAELWLRRLNRQPEGGRVFLSSHGVLCDHHSIGTWDWPGEDLLRRFYVLHSAFLAGMRRP